MDIPYWALLGWGIASWVLMAIFWRPDPPPDALMRYVIASLVGAAGGVAGGWISARTGADPMPGIGAVAGSLAFVGALRAFTGSGAVRSR